MVSQLLCIGIQAQLIWVSLPETSHKVAIKMLAESIFSSEGLTGRESGSKMTHIVVNRLQSFFGPLD